MFRLVWINVLHKQLLKWTLEYIQVLSVCRICFWISPGILHELCLLTHNFLAPCSLGYLPPTSYLRWYNHTRLPKPQAWGRSYFVGGLCVSLGYHIHVEAFVDNGNETYILFSPSSYSDKLLYHVHTRILMQIKQFDASKALWFP